MMKSKLIFIDPTLKSTIGHSFEYHQNVINCLTNEWGGFEVYCNKEFNTKFPKPVVTHPTISHSPTEPFKNWRELALIRKLYSWLLQTPFEIRNSISKSSGCNDVIFFQHVEYFLLPSLIFGFFGQARHAVVMLRSSPEDPVWFKEKAKKIFYKMFLRVLRIQLGRRLQLVTDSKLLCQSFEQLLNQPVRLLPIPLHLNEPSQNRISSSGYTVSFLGRLDNDKGSSFIPELVTTLSQKRNGCNFIIHNYAHPDHKSSLSSVVDELTALEREYPNVNLITSPVSSSEYSQTLASTDLMFFLYDPQRYRLQTSGLLVDALSTGVYPVVSDATWLAGIVNDCGFGSTITMRDNIVEKAINAYDDFVKTQHPRKNHLQGKHGYKEFKQAFMDLVCSKSVITR
ncbi:hypothetical protein N9L23_06320 [Alphaproteobacteria bacterium]|nr:hypothetical protein [Alphaproteobacteria bacterium]